MSAPPTESVASSAEAVCPRCDYDLRGEVDTWVDRCPLQSRCPECGLDVRWTEVYRIVPPPAWSVEHTSARKAGLVRSAFASGVRAFVPRHLWRRLSLAMPVVPARLVLMGFVWLMGSYVFAVVLMAATIWVEAWLDQRVIAALLARYPQSTAYATMVVPPSIWTDPGRWAFPYFRFTGGATGTPPQAAALCLVLVMSVPATLVLLPFSLRKARVRPRHILRLTAYWLLWAPVLVVVPAWTDSLFRMTFSFQGLRAYSGPMVPYQPGTPPARPDVVTRTIESVQNHPTVLVVGVLFVLVFWFWRNASRHYLRLPRPEAVALAISTITLLSTAAVGYFILSGNSPTANIVTQIFFEIIGK